MKETRVRSDKENSSGPNVCDSGTMPFVSVVVAVRNEARHVASTLQEILDQDYPEDRFEVIVADGRSTDETRSLVRALQSDHPNLHLVDNPRRLSSAGRNAAIRASRGETIVVIDGHCEFDDDKYLHNVVEAFQRSGADCLGRPQPQEVRDATPLGRAIAMARASWLGHHADSYIYSNEEEFVPAKSVAIAYRRSVFDVVGLFDESFDACEDVDLNHRVDQAGLTCFFTPKIQMRYFPRSSLRGLFRQLMRYGRGRIRLLRKNPSTLSLSSLLPAILVLGIVFGALSLWVSMILWWCYVGCLVFYLSILVLVSLSITYGCRDPRLLLWLPWAFLTIHFGAGVGILVELFLRRGNDQETCSHLAHATKQS